VTGNHKNGNKRLIETAPSNIVFSGYLNEKDYQSLLYSADILMALTTQDYTLLCGAYEGVSLFKPLIISNHKDLTHYFYKGVVITNNDAQSIAQSVSTAIKSYDVLKKEMTELHAELKYNWKLRFAQLLSAINQLCV